MYLIVLYLSNKLTSFTKMFLCTFYLSTTFHRLFTNPVVDVNQMKVVSCIEIEIKTRTFVNK